MTRWGWLILAPLLASCDARVEPPRPAAAEPPRPPAMCRVGPDGARPVADRGIGGTGGPARLVDRGIGGTGIIGVVTGFASVCVAGQEVAVAPDTAALEDDAPGRLDDLRAGQLVAINAAGGLDTLIARQVAVRHAVIGPVQQAGAMLIVAGQRVTPPEGSHPAVGAWIAVSGLRGADGVIAATRIDPAPPGRVLVRGDLTRLLGVAQIGGLRVVLPDGPSVPNGFPAVAEGRMRGAVLVASSVGLDVAAESPSAYFGPNVDTYIVETDITVAPGGYLVGRDFILGGDAGGGGRRIAAFKRRPGGGLVSSGVSPTGGPSPADPQAYHSFGAPGDRAGPGGGPTTGATGGGVPGFGGGGPGGRH